MPVSLEQWRASVGGINRSSSRVLARCTGRPKQGLGCSVLHLLLFLLVTCFCVGVWLVVKWGMSLKSLSFKHLLHLVYGAVRDIIVMEYGEYIDLDTVNCLPHYPPCRKAEVICRQFMPQHSLVTAHTTTRSAGILITLAIGC
jgi:hypothetical protein